MDGTWILTQIFKIVDEKKLRNLENTALGGKVKDL